MTQLRFSNNNKIYKNKIKQEWIKLEKWINAKQLKVILILEGDQNKTKDRFIKKLKSWSVNANSVKHFEFKKDFAGNDNEYLKFLISHLPQAGQIGIYESCWYDKALSKKQKSNRIRILEIEKILHQAGYIVLKYSLYVEENGKGLIFKDLEKEETKKWFHFKCSEFKIESISLIKHFIQQIPYGDLTFPHTSIDFSLLKKRAYNLRWATVEDGVIPLTAADPDFPIAPEIREAIKSYTNGGVFSYGPPTGLPEFREAAAEVLETRKGITCSPDRILPTDGAASGMFTIAKTILQAGDQVIIFDPVDFLFQKSVEEAGGNVIRIPFDPVTGSFNRQNFQQAISKKTKMICICNPHNPLGRVLTKKELRFIGSLAVKHNLWIMNDEIWSDIVYAPNEHINISSLDSEIAKRTISVYGFSKTFGLAGLRVGFIAAPSKKVFRKLLQTSQAETTATGVSTLSQVAAITAYKDCWYWVDAFLDHLTKVRNYSVNRLNKMPGIRCTKPEGTYLLFPNIQSFGLSSEEMAKYLLKKSKVAVVPGASKWFGPGAEGHIRLCFSTSMEIMKEALDRIEVALNELPINNSQEKVKIDELKIQSLENIK